jgi:hypothetical protein
MVLIVPWLTVVQVCELAQALAGENLGAPSAERRELRGEGPAHSRALRVRFGREGRVFSLA